MKVGHEIAAGPPEDEGFDASTELATRRAHAGLDGRLAVALVAVARSPRLAGCQSTARKAGSSGISETTQHGYVVIAGRRCEQVPVGLEQGPGADRPRLALDHRQLRRRGLSTTSARRAIAPRPSCRTRSSISASSPSISTTKQQVEHIANYGMKDGKVFDFITPHHADRRRRPELPAAGALRRHRLRRRSGRSSRRRARRSKNKSPAGSLPRGFCC